MHVAPHVYTCNVHKIRHTRGKGAGKAHIPQSNNKWENKSALEVNAFAGKMFQTICTKTGLKCDSVHLSSKMDTDFMIYKPRLRRVQTSLCIPRN